MHILCQSTQDACVQLDHILQETLGIVFFSKELWDHIVQEPGFQSLIMQSWNIVFFSKPPWGNQVPRGNQVTKRLD